MAKIKWENIVVGTSAFGTSIYLGRVEKDISNGHSILADKSEDRKDEIIWAVMSYMAQQCKINGTDTFSLVDDKIKLTCEIIGNSEN